jgi:dolichol-phosphate mannosyltransferase
MINLQYLSPKYEEKCRNMLRFAFVGATGALLNLAIIYALTNYIHMWYMISAIVAIECSILWNFYLNTKVTFNYRFSNRSEISAAVFKYHLLSFASTIINLTALFTFTEFLNIYFMFSEILAIMLAFGINYLVSARYVWSEKKST